MEKIQILLKFESHTFAKGKITQTEERENTIANKTGFKLKKQKLNIFMTRGQE